MASVRGSCLCGAVAWRAAGPFARMLHCHCSICRKAHGSAFATYVAAPAAGFALECGREQVAFYESSPGFRRAFCGRCGSVVPGEPGEGDFFIPAGPLDGDPAAGPQSHIFVGSKAPWHEITDAAEQFAAYPGFDGLAGPEPRSPAREGVTRGSCLCGAVAFEIEGPAELIINCHCSRCRKARAAAHGSNLFARDAQFRWVQGQETVASYKVPDAERFTSFFCPTCGASLPILREGLAIVPAGLLDDDPGGRERLHIFVGSKAPWYEITDGLPQFEEYAPGQR